MHELPPVLYVVNDPGLGGVLSPYAGLSRVQAQELYEAVHDLEIPARVWAEWLMTSDGDLETFEGWLRARPELLAEAKAIGTANLGGDLAVRDAALRAHWPGNVRYHVRQAATNAPREVKAVEASARDVIGKVINGWLAGNVKYNELQDHTAQLWRAAYEDVHEIGRNASGLDRLHPDPSIIEAEEMWFRSAVREELRYWHLALEEWKQRRGAAENPVALEQVDARGWERFEDYVAAIRFMFEGSRILALPPNVLLYWMGPKPETDKAVCAGCAYMMERSPFVKANVPAVPRDGQTPCLTNCRHKIVVRFGKLNEAEARLRELPTRESMVRHLARIKAERASRAEAGRKDRAAAHARRVRERHGRPHVHNPFHREGLGSLGQEPPP